MLHGVGSYCCCEFAWDVMSNITLSHHDDLLKPHTTFWAFYPERKKLLLLPFGTQVRLSFSFSWSSLLYMSQQSRALAAAWIWTAYFPQFGLLNMLMLSFFKSIVFFLFCVIVVVWYVRARKGAYTSICLMLNNIPSSSHISCLIGDMHSFLTTIGCIPWYHHCMLLFLNPFTILSTILPITPLFPLYHLTHFFFSAISWHFSVLWIVWAQCTWSCSHCWCCCGGG